MGTDASPCLSRRSRRAVAREANARAMVNCTVVMQNTIALGAPEPIEGTDAAPI